MEMSPLQVSPFVAKDMLVRHARAVLGPDAELLDASRGAPNWQQRTVQCAWHVLGLYADYCQGGPTLQPGVRVLTPLDALNHASHFGRFVEWMEEQRDGWSLGADYLQSVWQYVADELLPETTISDIIRVFTVAIGGGGYPDPPTLDLVTPSANRYLAYLLGENLAGEEFDVHLGTGATGVFSQVVSTMTRNRLLEASDKVAMVWPWYEPMKDLFSRQCGCEIVPLRRSPGRGWAVEEVDLVQLDDPAIKLVVAVSPGNPVDIPLHSECLGYLQQVVRRRPELVLLCDYVYANFVDRGFDNAAVRMPRNVIPFYSPSKDFGLAGCRIGATWIHRESALDERLRKMTSARAQEVDAKYAARHPEERPGFYERLVMDSAGVSFAHMAGLSTPNQVLFTLCALFPLVAPREAESYFGWVRKELRERMAALYEGLGLELAGRRDAAHSNYCAFISLDHVAATQGPSCAEAFARVGLWPFLKHLAHSRGTIIMPGPAFGGEAKSVRICLTSLGKSDCIRVGRNIAEAISDYSFPTPCPQCER